MPKDNFIDFWPEDDEEIIRLDESDFENVTSYVVSYNVATIIHLIEDDIIDLQPEFQRNFVWDIKRASKLIDSLLSNLPVPNVFLGRYNTSEKLIVIDGQQRLKTIYFFIKGYFDERGKPFRLKGLVGKRWDGKSFDELDITLQRKLINSVVNSTVLDNIEFKPSVFFELFYRLNTGGVPLTDQEIRNCIFAGDFNETLKKMNEFYYWKKLIEGQNFNKRMIDIELILRFYSLYNNKYLNYKSPMREWLNTCFQKNVHYFEDYECFYSMFERTTKKVYDEIGNDAFKGESKFNRAIFDAIMVSVASGIERGNLTWDLENKYRLLLANEEFKDSISGGTNNPHKVRSRINLAKEYLLDYHV